MIKVWKRLPKNFVKFGRGYKIIGMKIVWCDWGLRDVGSIFMFDDDSELRRILRLTYGSVPESLRSFWNIRFRWEFKARDSVSEKCHFAIFWISRFWLLICVKHEILSTLDSRKSRFGVREVSPQGSKFRVPGHHFVRYWVWNGGGRRFVGNWKLWTLSITLDTFGGPTKKIQVCKVEMGKIH